MASISVASDGTLSVIALAISFRLLQLIAFDLSSPGWRFSSRVPSLRFALAAEDAPPRQQRAASSQRPAASSVSRCSSEPELPQEVIVAADILLAELLVVRGLGVVSAPLNPAGNPLLGGRRLRRARALRPIARRLTRANMAKVTRKETKGRESIMRHNTKT